MQSNDKLPADKWAAQAQREAEAVNRLEAENRKLRDELEFYRGRERDICEAVGGICDGGRYRNDIIARLKYLYLHEGADRSWLPSETAPKHIVMTSDTHEYGPHILATTDRGEVRRVRWWQYKLDAAYCNFLGDDGNGYQIKAWMPLPICFFSEG